MLPPELDTSGEFEKLTNEAADRIVMLVKSQGWVADDILWLRSVRSRLADCGEEFWARAVDDSLGQIQPWQWIQRVSGVLGLHALAWLILILLYPHMPVVQGLLFRHAWFRRFFGFGYVSLLLTVVPALRRILFEPFRFSLVPKGALGNFQEETYFEACEVVPAGKRGAVPQRVSAVMEPICGQRVIEGASGLGKTTLLRHLATRSRHTVVLLRALDCKDGVLSAIQLRLQGQAQDENYLRTLVHAGARANRRDHHLPHRSDSNSGRQESNRNSL